MGGKGDRGDGEQSGAVEWQLLAITLLRRKTRRGGRRGAEVIKAPLGPRPLITGNVSTLFTPRLDHVATIGCSAGGNLLLCLNHRLPLICTTNDAGSTRSSL